MGILTRVKLNSKSEDAGQKAPPAAAEYVRVSINIAHNGLARDRRAVLPWRVRDGMRQTRLNDDVTLSQPLNWKRRHGPTGRDCQVLFAVLRQADVDKSAKVSISAASLLKKLRWARKGPSYTALFDALDYWSEVTLVFDSWHEPGQGNVERALPPPIKCLWQTNDMLRILVHADWHKLRERYFRAMPFPLPPQPIVQNALLKFPALPAERDEDYWWHTRPVSLSTLADKLGVQHQHAHRNAVVVRAIKLATAWLDKAGGNCTPRIAAGKVRFIYQWPKYLKPKAKKTKRKASR